MNNLLSTLTDKQLVDVLQDSGYTTEFDRAVFVKMNDSGKFVYRIEFINEGSADEGYVYVWVENDTIRADF